MYVSLLSPRLHKAYKARCVSLPVRLHPSVRRIQEVVSRVRALGSSSLESRTMVRDGLSGLTEIYRCLSEDLFKSSSETQQALLNSGLINELLEVSSKYLEVCGGAKDGASRIKKSVVELQSALRRSKKGGDFSLEGEVDAYLASRKEIKKEIKKAGMTNICKKTNYPSSSKSLHFDGKGGVRSRGQSKIPGASVVEENPNGAVRVRWINPNGVTRVR
ncbi:hypothetical protein Rs2_48625 [Raphanus sativus]|nr:hypothetical protein Rs2_48625 [Raphanus sativus]